MSIFADPFATIQALVNLEAAQAAAAEFLAGDKSLEELDGLTVSLDAAIEKVKAIA